MDTLRDMRPLFLLNTTEVSCWIKGWRRSWQASNQSLSSWFHNDRSACLPASHRILVIERQFVERIPHDLSQRLGYLSASKYARYSILSLGAQCVGFRCIRFGSNRSCRFGLYPMDEDVRLAAVVWSDIVLHQTHHCDFLRYQQFHAPVLHRFGHVWRLAVHSVGKLKLRRGDSDSA